MMLTPIFHSFEEASVYAKSRAQGSGYSVKVLRCPEGWTVSFADSHQYLENSDKQTHSQQHAYSNASPKQIKEQQEIEKQERERTKRALHEKAYSAFERIQSGDFSCIKELGEVRNPLVYTILSQLMREQLEKSSDPKIRDRMVRGQRKVYEVQHGTVLPDGGSIVNFGGLHDMRTWNW